MVIAVVVVVVDLLVIESKRCVCCAERAAKLFGGDRVVYVFFSLSLSYSTLHWFKSY